LGLGILAVKARRVSDDLFRVASVALSECSPALADPQAALLPPLDHIRAVSRSIAVAAARQAQAEGLAQQTTAEELENLVDATSWEPRYSPD
jgi:malate dehydrogenase (oxaloacetate-decarboxylating)